MNEITIPAMFDAHLHLRQDHMTDRIANYSGRVCDLVLAMPNTTPPIHDPDGIASMRRHYDACLGHGCRTLMTVKWLHRTTPDDVIAARQAGAVGIKLYPQGATTNAEDGIPFDWLDGFGKKTLNVLAEMQRQDMVLLCHGEAPGFVMNRERDFLRVFREITFRFPGLRMTLEHISTSDGLESIRYLRRLGQPVLGTITLHHMMTTLDDVIGGKLRPDLFCMPIPKKPRDRDCLLGAALSGEHCFALGSDSAPHAMETKYCSHGCAGVFTAPVLAESLVELFESGNALDQLGRFTSQNAMDFYRQEHSGRTITLVREDWTVTEMIGGVVPFRAGETIRWKIK